MLVQEGETRRTSRRALGVVRSVQRQAPAGHGGTETRRQYRSADGRLKVEREEQAS